LCGLEDVRDNRITGNLDSVLSTVLVSTTYHYIDLGRNLFTGSIPREISRHENISHLGLDFVALEGRIPSEIGLLTNLESLHLNGTALTGSLPFEM
jgi:hypothetical protein